MNHTPNGGGGITSATPTQPPTGAQLLNETREFLSRFVAFPNAAALDAVTLWIAHTHATDTEGVLVFETTPRLALVSDEPGSGKTRGLEMIEALCRRGFRMTDPTAPALASLITEEKATLLVDEIDMLFGTGDGQRPVRGILNAGYRRGAYVARQRGMQPCFAPVALAGLGQNFTSNPKLRPLYTRSVVVQMHKRPEGTELESYRERLQGPIADALKQQLAHWATSVVMDIATAWPDMPEGIVDRMADVWEPLITMGDMAGGEWPTLAREACRELALGESDKPPALTTGQQLLHDLRSVFFGNTQLTTSTIIERLYALRGGQWSTLWPNAGQAPRELSSLLRPFNVTPVKVWADGRALQGYKREQFNELFGPDSQSAGIESEELSDAQ